MKKIIAMLIATAIFIPCQATDFSGLSEFVKQSKLDAAMPSGTAIAIIKGDKIVYQGNFGYADIAAKLKVDKDTVFYTASITKPFFALATLLKEKQGDISESTTMAKLFPDLNFAHIDANKVQVKHLLAHTSALENNPMGMAVTYSGNHNKAIRRQFVEQTYASKESQLNEFDYNNLGYNILSVWFEKHYDQDWQQTLQETVFSPLKMTHTSAYMSDAKKHGWTVAKPYSVLNANRYEPLYLSKKDNTMHSAGGMISTAKDMARLLIAQMNQGKVDSKQVFPADVIEKSQKMVATTDRKYGDFKRTGYAWGWYTGPYKGQQMRHHFGQVGGTHTHLSYIPSLKIGIVILNNEDVLSGRFTGLIADYAYSEMLKETGTGQRLKNSADKLIGQFKAYEIKLAKKAKVIANRKWQLSLPMSAYQGSYYNKEHGGFEVTYNSKQQTLSAAWGNLQATATAADKLDSMRVELVPQNPSIAQFGLNNNKVNTVSLEGVTFNKR